MRDSGVSVPDTPFPRLNDATAVQEAFARDVKADPIPWTVIVMIGVGTVLWFLENLEDFGHICAIWRTLVIHERVNGREQ